MEPVPEEEFYEDYPEEDNISPPPADLDYPNEEGIRPPDEARRMRLVDWSDDEDDSPPQRRQRGRRPGPFPQIPQDDLHDAIIASSKSAREEEEEEMALALAKSLEEFSNDNSEEEISDEILKASEDEFKAHEEQLINSLIAEFNEKIKAERESSLPKFTERLKKLCWDENDRRLRDTIQSCIDGWINNQYERIGIEKELYEKIVKYLSTLYANPISKGREPAIPFEEYKIITNLIVEKN